MGLHALKTQELYIAFNCSKVIAFAWKDIIQCVFHIYIFFAPGPRKNPPPPPTPPPPPPFPPPFHYSHIFFSLKKNYFSPSWRYLKQGSMEKIQKSASSLYSFSSSLSFPLTSSPFRPSFVEVNNSKMYIHINYAFSKLFTPGNMMMMIHSIYQPHFTCNIYIRRCLALK